MGVFPAFFGLLMATLVTGQSIEITPREAVRRLGDELEVLCKVDYPIESCRLSIGKTSYILRPGDSDGEVIYHGQGLQSGECGAHIRNVKEEWNGLIMCYLPPKSGSIEVTGTMRLTVAKPPTDPVLISPPQPAFKEGEVFTAQCVVAGGRPTAKITWLLDDEELLAGVHQPIVTPEPESDLQTISQNVSRTLQADDAGRILTCRAEHEALLQPREAKRQLIVHYPPKVESESITIFGLQLNAEGRLNVTVRAQPSPRAEWSVGDHRLVAPMMSEDGLVSALEPLPLGGGYYNVTLVLSQIRKDDVERPYYLRLSNELGNGGLITIRISTMEEPAGVELDTGAIVGIVIAVLVLLIALSLVVFAFATDRWCFAGRSHRLDLPDADSEAPLPPHDDVKGSENPSHDHGDYISNGDTKHPEKKPDTAVSDTESAVGGKERSRLAQLGARVRAALPKGRDKVQATEAAPQDEEDNKPADDKVVYATLALSEHTPADKPPPAFAEYAEIVYTDQQKDAKENA